MKRSIGVFDSGMGGVSTLIELKKVLPNENFIYYGDSQNAPYGVKTGEEILNLSINVAEKLIEKDVKAIVIACNTATSLAANSLREKYKEIEIIGLEPAVKVGVDKGAKNILVMATQATLREKKFNELADSFKNKANIIKLPCPELVQIAENGLLSNEDLCRNQINEYLKDFKDQNIDAIILGCTHFLFYKKYIEEIVGNNCIILDGNRGAANFLKRKLEDKNLLNPSNEVGNVEFFNSQIKKEKEVDKLALSQEIYKMFY